MNSVRFAKEIAKEIALYAPDSATHTWWQCYCDAPVFRDASDEARVRHLIHVLHRGLFAGVWPWSLLG